MAFMQRCIMETNTDYTRASGRIQQPEPIKPLEPAFSIQALWFVARMVFAVLGIVAIVMIAWN